MTDTTDTPDEPVTGDVIKQPDVSGIWLSPPAAADRLGISERTLWRHVGAGRYHKRIKDGRAEVMVPTGNVSGVPDNPATPQTPALPDNDRQLSLDLLAELRRRLDEEADRQRRLTVKVERQAQEIGRLQAERDAERRRADDLAARLARDAAPRRRWWRRMFE